MSEYSGVLVAVKKNEQSYWEIGDVLIEAVGKPATNHAHTGASDKFKEVRKYLLEHGYDWQVNTLRAIRDTAAAFPHASRLASVSFWIHHEAGNPEVLERTIADKHKLDEEKVAAAEETGEDIELKPLSRRDVRRMKKEEDGPGPLAPAKREYYDNGSPIPTIDEITASRDYDAGCDYKPSDSDTPATRCAHSIGYIVTTDLNLPSYWDNKYGDNRWKTCPLPSDTVTGLFKVSEFWVHVLLARKLITTEDHALILDAIKIAKTPKLAAA